jgi:hypothetical protein
VHDVSEMRVVATLADEILASSPED